jgi:hypothetical protein
MAQAIQTRHFTDLSLRDADEAVFLLREAIQACCAKEAFTVAAQQMRSAREVQADFALNFLPLLSRLTSQVGSKLLSDIMDRFFTETDQSRFGLINAVTSLARDTRDPELRWGLEELGGGIAAQVDPKPVPDNPAAAKAHHSREILVG